MDIKTILKKIKYNYKNIFIFILFFILCLKISFSKADYESTYEYPCNPSEDSWKLYRNPYEDTIIVVDPYGSQ